MHKYVRVADGDYTIQVQEGGQITLDTSDNTGLVLVKGNLQVNGTVTNVNSTDVSIQDNIIILNDGETSNEVSLGTSGLRIDRGERDGSGLDAYFLFDESVSNGATGQDGIFTFSVNNDLRGIATRSINTAGGNLYLINSGNGVISVEGTNNYESHVTDPDHITNKKYVDDAITTAFATVLLSQIGDGVIDPTRVVVADEETTGQPSRIEFLVDNTLVGEWYGNRFEAEGIRIEGTRIETLDSNSDLELSSPGTGNVVVNDVLEIASLPTVDDASLEPSFPADSIKLYVLNEDTGGTGLYFANSSETRDELISNNRSLIYSMIF